MKKTFLGIMAVVVVGFTIWYLSSVKKADISAPSSVPQASAPTFSLPSSVDADDYLDGALEDLGKIGE